MSGHARGNHAPRRIVSRLAAITATLAVGSVVAVGMASPASAWAYEYSDGSPGGVAVPNVAVADIMSGYVPLLTFMTSVGPVAGRSPRTTGNQTISFLASDFDPGTTGYIVAIASDTSTGCPINFNFLIGDEFVKAASGFAARAKSYPRHS